MAYLFQANNLADPSDRSSIQSEFASQRRFAATLRWTGGRLGLLAAAIPIALLITRVLIPGAPNRWAAPMTLLTALTLILAAVALRLRRRMHRPRGYRIAAHLLAAIVLAIGVVRLAGYCFPSLHPQLNEALLPTHNGQYRVAPNTALNFVLIGLALLGLDVRSRRARTAAQWAALSAAVVSAIALLGYLYRAPSFYDFADGLHPMSLPTAVSFLLLGLGLMFVRPHRGPLAIMCAENLGGLMARRLLPACLLIPATLGWIRLITEHLHLASGPVAAATLVLIMTAVLVVFVGRNAALLVRLERQRQGVESQLKAARAAAENASHLKSAFVANISHELRTPLTAIVGFADLYFNPNRPAKERTDCVERIRRNGEHLLTIINDILDLSKIEAGRMRVEKLICAPAEIIAAVASMLRARALNKDLTLEVIYDEPIPQTIRTDPTRLRQALINLVSNAIKFTESGGVKIIASLVGHCYDETSMLHIRVVDTGIGISPEHQLSLFQPFVQADATMTRRFGGTGLGLSIAKHMAGLLGGDITVASEVGRGSAFTLTVDTGPLSDVALLRNPSEACVNADPNAQLAARAVKVVGSILLAEDGTENQALIEAYLREAGASVDIVPNGQLAIQKALDAQDDNRPYDLILMDMQMPVLDGFRATTLLREENYARPIVALTANAMPADRDRCLNAGCNDFLTKPIDPARLLKTVARYLRIPATNGAAAA